MLQGSLMSLLFSQVSLVRYKLLTAAFKNPSKHTFCLCVSFISRTFWATNTKKYKGKNFAFASEPWFIMFNYLCVLGTNVFL